MIREVVTFVFDQLYYGFKGSISVFRDADLG